MHYDAEPMARELRVQYAVHLNPARAQLSAPEQPLLAYLWSSYLL